MVGRKADRVVGICSLCDSRQAKASDSPYLCSAASCCCRASAITPSTNARAVSGRRS